MSYGGYVPFPLFGAGGGGGPSGLLTPRPASASTTAADGELVEMDATGGIRVITGPAAGVARRWGGKKVNGIPEDAGNKVTVVYVDHTGVDVSLDLVASGDSVIFYASGSGYAIESGYTPPASLLATAYAAAIEAAAGVVSTVWFGDVAATPRPPTSAPVVWVGLTGTVPVNAIDDYDPAIVYVPGP